MANKKQNNVDVLQIKIRLQVPCLFIVSDEKTAREKETAPAVDCDLNCRECGWNPEVRERRLMGMF